jgi:hypothetical protein
LLWFSPEGVEELFGISMHETMALNFSLEHIVLLFGRKKPVDEQVGYRRRET